jgi:hypothetical protein
MPSGALGGGTRERVDRQVLGGVAEPGGQGARSSSLWARPRAAAVSSSRSSQRSCERPPRAYAVLHPLGAPAGV